MIKAVRRSSCHLSIEKSNRDGKEAFSFPSGRRPRDLGVTIPTHFAFTPAHRRCRQINALVVPLSATETFLPASGTSSGILWGTRRPQSLAADIGGRL